MRHNHHPNMTHSHLMRNLTSELIVYRQLRLTAVTAKKLQRHVERLITLAKAGTLAARRRARNMMILHHPPTADPLKTLFVLVRRYRERPGGYTRILRLAPRAGDNAPLVSLQFVS